MSVAAAVAIGCHQFPNVFIDDLPDGGLITTSSAAAARQLEVAAADRGRGFPSTEIAAQDGAVAHGPLWFEEPYEMCGSTDGRFAVTGDDLVIWPLSVIRFGLNAALFPLSVAAYPPWVVQCSDGVCGREIYTGACKPYDAVCCNGVAPPVDVGEVRDYAVGGFVQPQAADDADVAPGESTGAAPGRRDAPDESASDNP